MATAGAGLDRYFAKKEGNTEATTDAHGAGCCTDSEPKPVKSDASKTLIVGGIRIQFPFQPYPSQLMMMSNIVKALCTSNDALLESPTGSGKTMALLCASLAWQQTEAENLRAIADVVDADKRSNIKDETAEAFSNEESLGECQPKQVELAEARKKRRRIQQIPSHTVQSNNVTQDGISSDDEFKPRVRSTYESSGRSSSTRVQKGQSVRKSNSDVKPAKHSKAKRPPKIFFGTRTHKQITQVIAELKRTAYGRSARMTILSSREHTCIHSAVSKSSNKNEDCAELLKQMSIPGGNGCRFYHNVKSVASQTALNRYGTLSTWDIEDLVKIGRRVKGCPYFGARELVPPADIVFCPYNYLIDPLIREQLGIVFDNNIVIIDEAHNIEDSARESASCNITTQELAIVRRDLEKVRVDKSDDAAKLLNIVTNISDWVDEVSEKLQRPTGTVKGGFEAASKELSGEQSVAVLESLGLTKVTVPAYQEMLNRLIKQNEDSDDVEELSRNSANYLQKLLFSLDLLLGNEGKNLADFSVVVERRVVEKSSQRRGAIGPFKRLQISLGFWCFNPALTFRKIADVARSVILTSGTLAPLNTFSSELATQFPFRIEANHVVDESQLWARSLSHGPRNHSLHVTYKNVHQLQFQDEIGQLLMRCCEAVPFGVLVFVPSYSLLDIFVQRWKSTGLWKDLSKIKTIVTESRKADKAKFETEMQRYFKAVDRAVASMKSTGTGKSATTGGLMLAVTRGKVSEGIDFTDAYARAVINLGIPFPSTKDDNIAAKKRFNNRFSKTRGLLNGDTWYETQAFRALNQGLGRCIRHRNDWGAVLLVDCRFSSNIRYQRMLSKWVRQILVQESSFERMLTSLKDFVSRHHTQNKSEKEPSSSEGVQQLMQSSLQRMISEKKPLNVVETLDNEAENLQCLKPTVDDPCDQIEGREFTQQSLLSASASVPITFSSAHELGETSKIIDVPVASAPLSGVSEPRSDDEMDFISSQCAAEIDALCAQQDAVVINAKAGQEFSKINSTARPHRKFQDDIVSTDDDTRPVPYQCYGCGSHVSCRLDEDVESSTSIELAGTSGRFIALPSHFLRKGCAKTSVDCNSNWTKPNCWYDSATQTCYALLYCTSVDCNSVIGVKALVSGTINERANVLLDQRCQVSAENLAFGN